MKKRLSRMHKILFAVIGVLAVVLIVVMVRKVNEWQQDKIKQQELEVRHQETQSELEDVELQIKELSGDGAALQEFLNNKINKKNETDVQVQEDNTVSGNVPAAVENVPEQVSDNSVSENAALPAGVSDNSISDNSVSENAALPAGVSDNNSISDNSVSENAALPVSVSNNSVSGNNVSGNSVSGNAIVDGVVIPFREGEQTLTLEDRRKLQSSYAETMQINEKDKEVIASNAIDFSGITIACLGDSLTEGNTGDDGTLYAYPAMLKTILNAKEVYNYGIGGSSLGRYWDKAFVDRYKEIPADTSVILVMGGTNDGFCASQDELGSLAEKKKRTFYGDVDELMRGLKADYPNARIVFATPLPNVLHDYLMTQKDYLLPQSVYAEAIKELAAQYGIDVIDLYNSNFLDTHDSQIITGYMPDGVHGNEAGYQILAEHLAGALIDILNRDIQNGPSVSGNTVSGNLAEESVSDNTAPEEDMESQPPVEEEPETSFSYQGDAIIIQ